MKNVEYVALQDVDNNALLTILNKSKIRSHLVEHETFDVNSLNAWVQDKIKVNSSVGCRVRAIKVDGTVAGWCGIQLEQDSYELAIVLDDQYWGVGISVFRETMRWAFELGHQTVVLHLLHTRPEYRFLKKLAVHVYTSTIFGQLYTTYELAVESTKN